MILPSLNRLLKSPKSDIKNVRKLWTYVAKAFNIVDTDRLQQVGPDRLCAEWVLKNSGAVSFTDTPGVYLRDYNSLPPENVRLKLKEIDATNATIMKVGLDHLKGCAKIDLIVLRSCKHLEDEGLEGLVHVKDTLQFLEVSDCQNLTDNCLMVIKQLPKLKELKLSDLQYVKNMDNVRAELSKCLKHCKIEIS